MERKTVMINGKRVKIADLHKMTGLTVGRSLYLTGCTGLTALPEGLSVGGSLFLNGCTGLTHVTTHAGVKGGIYR